MVTRTHVVPTCVYCGEREGATRDHVPPKGLFATPRPGLVTVPCCELCRKSQSLDDEYFVQMISMRRGTTDNTSAIAARQAALRSLTKPNKVGATRALLRSMKDLPVYSASGIYLGHTMMYDVNLHRLDRVITRTVIGLYFHEFKDRLPDGHRCKTYAIEGIESADPEVTSMLHRMWAHAVSGKRNDFGDGIFTYWVQRINGPEAATLWAFVVYDCVPFMAFTGPLPTP